LVDILNDREIVPRFDDLEEVHESKHLAAKIPILYSVKEVITGEFPDDLLDLEINPITFITNSTMDEIRTIIDEDNVFKHPPLPLFSNLQVYDIEEHLQLIQEFLDENCFSDI